MAKDKTPPAPAPQGGRVAQKRPLYPGVLTPSPADRKAHARRKRKWFPQHKSIWMKTQAYVAAKRYLSRPHYQGLALWVGGVFMVLGLAAFFGWQDPISHAMRSGFTSPDGGHISRVNPVGLALLFTQGALSIYGLMRIMEKQKRTKAMLTQERYDDWLQREDVKQDDLQNALLPTYATPNPYDPTDPAIQIVLGEHYDNDAHKFGPVAHWYAFKLKGMQTGGTVIFGITGSGKTSSTLRPIMRQVFGWMSAVDFDPDNKGREKMAGFVLDPKGALPAEVHAVLKSAGVDPIIDAIQSRATGPVTLSPLYHALHSDEPKGASGDPIFNPAIIEKYRGRLDDYLELGYDAARVDRVWTYLQKLQEASKGFFTTKPVVAHGDSGAVDHGILRYGNLPVPEGQAPMTLPLIEFLNGHKQCPFTRTQVGLFSVHLRGIEWGIGGRGASGLAPLPALLGHHVEALASWLWIGRLEASFPLPGGRLPVHLRSGAMHPQAPATPFAQAYSLDAYAVSRNQIRRFAPLKIRPTSGVNEYRDAWAMRELRMWEFRDAQVAQAARVSSYAQLMALTRRSNLRDKVAERDEAFATHLAEDMKLFTTPLDELVGQGAVAKEYDHPKASGTPELRALINRVKSGLSAGLSEAFQAGDYHRLTVPLSERPTPHPADGDTKARMKGRWAASDPMVNLAMEAATMRAREGELLASARRLAANDLKVAKKELEGLAEEWGQRIERLLATLGKKAPVNEPALVLGLVEALVVQWGGVDGLLQDGLATVLGMPCVPPPTEGVLLDKYLFLADDLGDEVHGLSYAASHPFAHDLARGLRAGIDATHANWRHMANLSVVADAMKDLLGHLALNPTQEEAAFRLVRGAVDTVLDAWIICHLAALEAALEGPLKKDLAALGQDQVALFKEAAGLVRMGAFRAAVDDPLALTAEARADAVGPNAPPSADWTRLMWAGTVHMGGARRGPFWRGAMSGRDMTPLHAAQWDEAWGFLVWRTFAFTMASGETIDRGTYGVLADLVGRLSGYHCAALEAFTVSVAPNIAWRTDGPYTYNPLYAPDLLPIIVAGTFNATIFAATSDGKDSSDPFWENSGFAVVLNLFNLCTLVDGYATFPKIYNLATNEPLLEEYLGVIRRQRTERKLSVEDSETVTKVLSWAHSEWLTEASAKSETKDNIIRSLSVVSEGFKDPKFAFCFAPAVKEDISFPSWSWVMKEGKVVCGALPLERYEKIAQVVLPLANRTFQKAVLMRDGARKENEVLEREARGQINALERQAAEISARIDQESAERLALDNFFGLSAQVDRGNGIGDGFSRARVGGHSHPLTRWRVFQHQGAHCQASSLGDDLMTQGAAAGCGPMGVAALVGGTLGKLAPFQGVYYNLARAEQAWVESGVFLRGLEALKKSGTLRAQAEAGDSQAGTLLTFLDEALSNLRKEDLAKLGLSSKRDLDAGLMPAFLTASIAQVFDRDTMVRVKGRSENLTFEHRGAARAESGGHGAPAQDGSARTADAAGTGAALRPRTRVRALYQEIRELEQKIASMPNTERTVAYIVDEAHFFVQGKADAEYVTVARSNNAINFYSTQSPANLNAKMGEDVARQFYDSLPNRIILRMPDSKAAEECAEFLGGKKRQRVIEKSVSHSFDDFRANGQAGGGQGKSTGGSVSVNIKHEDRWIVDISQIINLRAMEAFAFTWNGKENSPPVRIYMKPDYLYTIPEIRSYNRSNKRYADLPPEYQDGMDLHALPVPSLLELGVIDASR